MYTIIGGDGREYGPVTADQVRQWMAAGRANLQTKAKLAGTDEWKPLSDFPDFQAPPPFTSDTPAGFPAAPAAAPAAAVAAAPSRFDPLECFAQSWQLMKRNFWPFVGATALLFLIQLFVNIVTRLPFRVEVDPQHPWVAFHSPAFAASIVAGILFTGPVYAGYMYYLLRRARGEPATISDLFSGFSRAYFPLVGASLLCGILEMMGFFVLILPGIYLCVAYGVAPLTIVDRRCGSWAGMEASRRGITRRWWSFFLVLILCALLAIAGVLCLGVGLLVAMPVSVGALVYAYLSLIP